MTIEPAAATLFQQLGVGFQHLEDAGPDRAEPGDGYLQRIYHDAARCSGGDRRAARGGCRRDAGFLEELTDVAAGLPDAVLVFDQRQTDMAVAVLAEADARAHRDLGFLKQQLAEFQLPRWANCGGIGAQANMLAGGLGTCQPAAARPSISTSRRAL